MCTTKRVVLMVVALLVTSAAVKLRKDDSLARTFLDGRKGQLWLDEAKNNIMSRLATATESSDLDAAAPKVGLAVQGGGHKAYAAATGIMAGLMAAAGQDSPAEVLSNVDMMASSSGGSWWSATFLWSDYFAEILADMAAGPAESGELYAARWLIPWLKHSGGIDDVVEGLLTKEGYDWKRFTAAITEFAFGDEGGDALESLTFASPPAKWVNDSPKTWFCGVAVPTCSESEGGGCLVNKSPMVKYWITRADDEHVKFRPDSYSVTLGLPGGAQKALPFCTKDDDDNQFHYNIDGERNLTITGGDTCGFLNELSPENIGLLNAYSASGNFAALVDSDNVLKVLEADLGDFVNPSHLAPAGLKLKLTTVVKNDQSPSTSGAFSAEDEGALLSKPRIIADSGYADNSGINWLLRAGASEIVYFALDPENLALLRLLDDYNPSTNVLTKLGVKDLIPVLGLREDSSFTNAEHTQSEAPAWTGDQDICSFRDDQYLTSSSKYPSVKYYELEFVTIDNKVAEVTGGRNVKIHVINVNFQDWITGALSPSFDVYPPAVGCVTSILAYNAPSVRTEILGKMLHVDSSTLREPSSVVSRSESELAAAMPGRCTLRNGELWGEGACESKHDFRSCARATGFVTRLSGFKCQWEPDDISLLPSHT